MIKDDHFGRMELFMSLLEMNGICKSFNGIQVLKEVSLRVEAGEVHALLGENGAGKSTLMNILTGVHDKDAGTVVFDGKEMKNISVKSSENAGIAFVHQELNLFNDLKVYENIFLCREYTNKFGIVDTKRMIKESRELFEGLGVEIDPEIEVSGLTTSQKQLLEISKALFFKAKLLILDEPTNDVDIPTVTILEDYLNAFSGIVITVSHDRYFLDNVVDRIFEFDGNGTLRQYEGGYTDYREAKERRFGETGAISSVPGGEKEKKERSTGKDWKQNRPTKLKFTYK